MKKGYLKLVALLIAMGSLPGEAQVVADVQSKVIEKDADGRIIRVEEAGDVTSYLYDELGRLDLKQSERFGTTEYTYVPGDSSGPFARARTIKQSNVIGEWKRQFIYDADGHRVLSLEDIDQDQLERVAERLQPYFWPEGLHQTTVEAMDPLLARDYASLAITGEGSGVEVQRTKIFGLHFEIQSRPLGEGKWEIRDDRGGRRVETWGDGNLIEAHDDTGPLIETKLDSLGRPERLVIGGNTVIRYVFEGSSGRWIEKEVTNESDGAIIGSWKRPDDYQDLQKAPLPRRSVIAFLQGSIPIAEWDGSTSGDGMIQVPRRGEPYALIPFGEEEVAWRSISSAFASTVAAQERIDYTDTQVRIFIHLGPASVAAGGEAVVSIERSRRRPVLARGAEP